MSIAEVQRDLAEVFWENGRAAEAVRCWNEAADGFARVGASVRATELRERATAARRE
jgi:hypothetical protein